MANNMWKVNHTNITTCALPTYFSINVDASESPYVRVHITVVFTLKSLKDILYRKLPAGVLGEMQSLDKVVETAGELRETVGELPETGGELQNIGSAYSRTNSLLWQLQWSISNSQLHRKMWILHIFKVW
eukprot:1189953-Prorocentrum_minimum.AAC.2